MNKSILTYTLIAAAATLAACTDADTDNPAGGTTPISFGTTVETRAAIGTDKAGMQPFAVWGGYGTSHDNLFNKTPVNPDGTYTGGDRYWVLGQPHNFCAHHPYVKDNTLWEHTTSGAVTYTNFDCSATGTNAIDLMTAATGPITPQTADDVQPVSLQFRHELAQVKFSIKAQSQSPVTLTAVKLHGVAYKGNFTTTCTDPTTAEWTLTDYATDANDIFSSTGLTQSIIPDTPYAPFGGYLLLIPQELNSTGENVATLELTYYYGSDSSNSITSPITLHTAQTSQWQAGQSYQYILTIPGTDAEVDFTVTAGDWEPNNVFEEL